MFPRVNIPGDMEIDVLHDRLIFCGFRGIKHVTEFRESGCSNNGVITLFYEMKITKT